MKKVTTLVFGFLLMAFSAKANAPFNENGKRYIFVENGVEFSVFPDGQFDFVYLGNNNAGEVNVNINTPTVNISYNSGHDYETYVQYDDYGAVIQIENVPIYYDAYGRIVQAGDTEIRYNKRRIVRVGGLQVFYNNYGHYSYCTGYINLWTPRYIFRPWHTYYVAPIYTSCIVYDVPYRRYYSPIRYSYFHHRNYYKNRHRVAYSNGRRSFNRPGSRVHYKNGRTAINRNYNATRRNTAITGSGRNTPKGRPAIANTRPTSGQNIVKGRPTVTNTRPTNGNTRPAQIQKGRPSSRPALAKHSGSQKGRPEVNASRTRPTKAKPRPSNSQRGKPATVNRSTPSKRKENTVSRKRNTSRPKSSVSRKSKPSKSRGVAPRRSRG